ncbi:MAG: NUDIX domain-containing protein [bacterium]
MKKQRFKIIPAVYLILTKKDEVLLIRRFQTGFCDGQYGLPSGHLEGKESIGQALIREIKEEIGISIRLKDVRLVHVLSRRADDGERIDIFFTVKNWKGEPKIMEPHKCDDMRFFPIKKPPKNTVDYIKEVFRLYLKGIAYGEYGWKD